VNAKSHINIRSYHVDTCQCSITLYKNQIDRKDIIHLKLLITANGMFVARIKNNGFDNSELSCATGPSQRAICCRKYSPMVGVNVKLKYKNVNYTVLAINKYNLCLSSFILALKLCNSVTTYDARTQNDINDAIHADHKYTASISVPSAH
jgi:hypothetical protein